MILNDYYQIVRLDLQSIDDPKNAISDESSFSFGVKIIMDAIAKIVTNQSA